jgi:hypothetical protein
LKIFLRPGRDRAVVVGTPFVTAIDRSVPVLSGAVRRECAFSRHVSDLVRLTHVITAPTLANTLRRVHVN